ncbi:Rsd/AlgQ family anti-sigma factor [Litorivicinus lipolyticus]|uniref:Rsd/AlgQ family anti-sigma factor n=1 Tax=Litorivicinus lipolyticus TaxID=418701 RepID=UPI003B5AB538
MLQTIERSDYDRRASSQSRLFTLLDTRRQTWMLYSQLADARPFKSSSELDSLVHRFCQTLIDYTASAHFQLYHRLAEGTEARANLMAVAETIYPVIARSTDVILTFNDAFGEHDQLDGEALDAALSYLGETLVQRIELEDRILGAARHDRRSDTQA